MTSIVSPKAIRIPCLLAALVGSPALLSQELGCGISVIPEAQIKRGCGCGYQLRTDSGLHSFFQAGLNSSDEPRMHINGELVELQASASNAQNKYAKQGDEFIETYKIGNTTIRFHNTVSSACADGSEGCDVIVFDTTMTVETGSCNAEVKNLVGDCGC